MSPASFMSVSQITSASGPESNFILCLHCRRRHASEFLSPRSSTFGSGPTLHFVGRFGGRPRHAGVLPLTGSGGPSGRRGGRRRRVSFRGKKPAGAAAAVGLASPLSVALSLQTEEWLRPRRYSSGTYLRDGNAQGRRLRPADAPTDSVVFFFTRRPLRPATAAVQERRGQTDVRHRLKENKEPAVYTKVRWSGCHSPLLTVSVCEPSKAYSGTTW